MEFETALATVLIILTFSPNGSSQDVPDSVVYTEVEKTLVIGAPGVLTCRFKGDPNAVYWKKGEDPKNAPSIMTWSYGSKFGPRYEDDSCDMDENYSLIIKNVTSTDSGRFICRVSNYNGILIHNYTDVAITDAAVITKSAVNAQKGRHVVLPCQVLIRPIKVSWVKSPNETLVFVDLSHHVLSRGGPGYDEGLLNITNEYSLVIYDVTIQHEDKYVCRVTDYETGTMYRDATKLTVFAYPREPFPLIRECPVDSSSSCTLRIQSATTLTCQVEGFYPNIDLYFVHGSVRVYSLETRAWNNSDGTSSKTITITTDGIGESSFECVADGLVGRTHTRSMTIHLIREGQKSRVAVAFVVPVILISAVTVIAIFVFKRRKREYTRVPVHMVYKAAKTDLISYIEIWMLVKYAREQKVRIGKILDHLPRKEPSSQTLQTNEDYYQEMCKWKAEYTGTCQREDFFNLCRNKGLKAAFEKLAEYSDSTRALTEDDLAHTLWHIDESGLIVELLKQLGALHEDDERVEELKTKGKGEVIEGAMNILKYWRDVNNTGNQEVMLSVALEMIQYSPNDEDFFRIPELQKCGLNKNEIKAFLLPQVTSRHCTELVNAMVDLKEKYVDLKWFGPKNKDVWIDEIIEQNRTALFDSHQMIEDWWPEQNCSNYEKRCRLQHAAHDLHAKDTSMNDHKEIHSEHSDATTHNDALKSSDEKWPTTMKLEQIVKLVPLREMIQLCKALHITYTPGDLDDEGKRLKVMCRWRDGISEREQKEKHKELSSALKSLKFERE